MVDGFQILARGDFLCDPPWVFEKPTAAHIVHVGWVGVLYLIYGDNAVCVGVVFEHLQAVVDVDRCPYRRVGLKKEDGVEFEVSVALYV